MEPELLGRCGADIDLPRRLAPVAPGGGGRRIVAPTPQVAQRPGEVGLLGMLDEVGVTTTLLAAQFEQGLAATLSPIEPVPTFLDAT